MKVEVISQSTDLTRSSRNWKDLEVNSQFPTSHLGSYLYIGWQVNDCGRLYFPVIAAVKLTLSRMCLLQREVTVLRSLPWTWARWLPAGGVRSLSGQLHGETTHGCPGWQPSWVPSWQLALTARQESAAGPPRPRGRHSCPSCALCELLTTETMWQ